MAEKYSEQVLNRGSLRVLTSGIAAIAMLIADAASAETADPHVIADAAYLLHDLAHLAQEAVDNTTEAEARHG